MGTSSFLSASKGILGEADIKAGNDVSATSVGAVDTGRLGNSVHIPLEEQLMSDDIQQVYANRLHFQQKIK